MGCTDPLDLAARASNLAERLQAVTALGGPRALPGAAESLDALDRWKIRNLAGKLADKFHQESLHRAEPPQHTQDELTTLLTAFRCLERNLHQADDTVRGTLRALHDAWLPTYEAALDFHEQHPGEAAARRARDEHYGRLAKACEPFLLHLGHSLRAVCAEHPMLSEQLAENVQDHFLDRFELALAWAVEADAKVHCAEAGIDADSATTEDYLRYLDETFADSAAYHRFYLKYPVLGRWLAHTTALLIAHGRELFQSLAQDAEAIADEFFGERITAFTALRLGDSDPHAGGRTVARITAELADGGVREFFHKPRSVRSEAALQELLGRLADDGVLGFATRPVLPRDGYGYEALIPPGRNHVDTPEQAARIYEELGGLLAVFYVLGGSDLHFENVIIADGHAFVCDAETLLGVRPQGRAHSEGTLLDSVFKTGLLEWPRAERPAGEAAAEMRISGYTGGEGRVPGTPPVMPAHEHTERVHHDVNADDDDPVRGGGRGPGAAVENHQQDDGETDSRDEHPRHPPHPRGGEQKMQHGTGRDHADQIPGHGQLGTPPEHFGRRPRHEGQIQRHGKRRGPDGEPERPLRRTSQGPTGPHQHGDPQEDHTGGLCVSLEVTGHTGRSTRSGRGHTCDRILANGHLCDKGGV
ncbi:DUF4135 domain-containing protein [Streptomyces sp. ET3-23]|uniref:DUF4135 domain-containing protein n=1 Tax=Streptomyces sp. ET3-23 TaxID=2885643 RepID=UPI001D12146A|nr:DUF4135 domain-containing protein [Streptomyces sp. ET3-23]MCC2276111.1 DUF4135 domain-containing protein [Streptomyces sp. ET3-23]